MSEQIKSLADEIREKLKGTHPAPAKDVPAAKNYTEAQVTKFFAQLDAFECAVDQKSVIRVDARTMKLLRHLKLVRGVEMNKFIVFALHQLLAKNPWLSSFIQDSLKNPDL